MTNELVNNKNGGSHSAIKFEKLPVVPGPLSQLNTIRDRLLGDVITKTASELSASAIDLMLGEALYSERIRLKRGRGNVFTRPRYKRDRVLWNEMQAGLLQSPALVDRARLLERVLWHYADEIGGHFNARIYSFAINAVPWGFNWLLNAASVKRFLPWGMTESLKSRLKIVGEVTSLQRLAEKGTILLVPTHQSNIDSILIGYVIYLMSLPPFAYGAGLNLFSNPILSFFMGRLGAYTVDRQKNNLLYKQTLKNYSARILQEGIHSVFFPGGGRSRSGAIESSLKLGLLGTGLQAQILNLQNSRPKPNIFVVPMVTSYNFVLEAASLIDDHLAEEGKHRFIITDDESWQPLKVINFFWKLFSSSNDITVRIGRPLDVFGNFVNDDGQSLGPNGTTIDPGRWLSSQGKLTEDLQRDQEYTRELGARIVERFHRENTVLASHLVAFSFFECLRRQYPDLDLFRFLRISLPQRSCAFDKFLMVAENYHNKLRLAADSGLLYLSDELKTSDTKTWVSDGIKNLGLLHDTKVVQLKDGVVWTEDMNLLYYYRNRLIGYGFERDTS